MTGMARVGVTVAIVAFLGLTPWGMVFSGGAQEPTDAEAPAEESGKSRFALYVETAFGSAESEAIDTSLVSSASRDATGSLTIDDSDYGRAAVGWKLPEDRGRFLMRFEGYKENGYEYTLLGNDSRVVSDVSGASLTAGSPLPWWRMTVTDGRLNSEMRPPLWDDTPVTVDLDGDGMPDTDPDTGQLITYEASDTNRNRQREPGEVLGFGAPEVTIARGAPRNLQVRIQNLDLIYDRDFGGRTISGRWSTGLRYTAFEGNVPAGAWLLRGEAARLGFTDGGFQGPLTFSQETSGVGPTGSLEIQFHFLRDRLVLYGQGRFAFMIQNVEMSSGTFYALQQPTPAPGPLEVFPARLIDDRDKSAWQLTGEIGATVEIVRGLHLRLAYSKNSFQDVILMPTKLSVVPGDVTSQVKTKDYELDTVFAGLGIQF